MAATGINMALIFELSKTILPSKRFDIVLHAPKDFIQPQNRRWRGCVWADLTMLQAFSTSGEFSPTAINPTNASTNAANSGSDASTSSKKARIAASPSPQQQNALQQQKQPALISSAPHFPIYEGTVEHVLQLIFTRFENKEFSEGMFVLKAEYGADWFTPVMQHPHCILRQPNHTPPAPQGMKRSFSESTLSECDSTSITNGHSNRTHKPYESLVLFYLGPNAREFCSAFYAIGLIPGVNCWSAVMIPDDDMSLLNSVAEYNFF